MFTLKRLLFVLLAATLGYIIPQFPARPQNPFPRKVVTIQVLISKISFHEKNNNIKYKRTITNVLVSVIEKGVIKHGFWTHGGAAGYPEGCSTVC